MRNINKDLQDIALCVYVYAKKLCVECGESPHTIKKDKINTRLSHNTIKDKIKDFAKLPNAKISIDDNEIIVYEVFAEYILQEIKYEILKNLQMRKIKAKQAIMTQQRNLSKIYLRKAKRQAMLAVIRGEILQDLKNVKNQKKLTKRK